MKKNKRNNKKNKLSPQQERAEKLALIGAKLKVLRQEQELSLEEVAFKTLIRVSQLRAIEEGQLEKLPEPVYIQGFIKRFANALGLNGELLAQDFPTDSFIMRLRPFWQYLPAAQLRPIHLYLVYIAVIICAVNSLSYLIRQSAMQASDMDNNRDSEAHPTLSEGKVIANQPKNLGPLKTGTIIKNKTPNQPHKPVRVGVIFKAQSWIRVVADGKMEFEGTLPEGTQRTWVADEKLVVLAGNAGGVLVAFNDEKAKQLGSPGMPEEVTFKATPRS